MMILERIPDKFERWQTAAGLALAGAFGTGACSYLEPFWLDEAQGPEGPGINAHTAPFHTVDALKTAAIAADIIPSTTATLTDSPSIWTFMRNW